MRKLINPPSEVIKDYVILLHYRYKGSVQRMADAHNLDTKKLTQWYEDFIIPAKREMRDIEELILAKEAKDAGTPDIDDLISEGMMRLKDIIKSTKDPQGLVNAIVKLKDMKPKAEEMKENELDLFDEVERVAKDKIETNEKRKYRTKRDK